MTDKRIMKLSVALYVLDPANTSCKENGAIYEYDSTAAAILEEVLDENKSFINAIYSVFSMYFSLDEDEVDAPAILDAITRELVREE